MARIPSFEEVLLEIHQSLGLERPQSKYKNAFADLGLPLDKHQEMFTNILDSILSALDLDERARKDISFNFMKFSVFHKSLELHTWTGNASQQQVLWHLLAYSYVPGLARRVAFWSLAGNEAGQPMDAGMPGGKFWFLPNYYPDDGRISFPVPQLIDWLLDLLGQPQEQAFQGLEREQDGREVNAHALRKLKGWRLEGRLPKSGKEIDELFHDDAKLEFYGAYKSKSGVADEERFKDVLDFIEHKQPNAEMLCFEIPIAAERLKRILTESSSDEERLELIRLVELRYAKPTMRILRQRFKVARLVQDGYRRLSKYLCGNDVDEKNADPTHNKVLQLIGLFQYVYNMTIAASKNGTSFDEQDVWFEAQIPPWDKADLLLSITPSLRHAAHKLLAERLTRKFMALKQDSPLEDFFPQNEQDAARIIEHRVQYLKKEYEEDQQLEKLIARVRTSSPWRALQAVDSYWVVSQFAHREGLSSKLRDMALQRMAELATTPGQQVGVIVLELGFLLNCEPKQRPRDVQQQVQSLLDRAMDNPGHEEWKVAILQYQAKHKLMQNDFGGAKDYFSMALEACSERSFGYMRGEIARNAFAVEVADRGFIPEKQEKYYRNMGGYGMFIGDIPSFEDTATWCEEFFWSDLYSPYPGFEWEEMPAVLANKAIIRETFELIMNSDWDGLRAWLQRHAKKFRKTNLQEARRNSVLLVWLKLINMARQLDHYLSNWGKAIHIIIEAWPEQARIADFKGQTPLMLAADRGDTELTKLLAPLSDADAQDYHGRTALHAAICGGSTECVTLVLDLNPDTTKVTTENEGNTALHTAVRFGVPENVRLILDEFPGLVLKTNALGQTPLDMANEILDNLPRWQEFMRKNNRKTGTEKNYRETIALLTEVANKLN
jgi:hypothetical protein